MPRKKKESSLDKIFDVPANVTTKPASKKNLPTVTMKPIMVILGNYGYVQSQLTAQVLSDTVEAKYVKWLDKPENVFPLEKFINDILPSVVAEHNKKDLLVITTNNIPIIETLKGYIRSGDLKVADLGYLYATDENVALELELTEEGEWVGAYPDASYEITANALKSFIKNKT